MSSFGSRSAAVSWRPWHWLVSLSLAFVVIAPGCGTGGGPPPPGGQLQVETVAKWYQLYRASNGNKTPPNEQAFVAFITSKLKERGDTVPDLEGLLKSPRDGQKYVINYGKPTSPKAEKNVAVYESEGYNGKKWLAFESAWSQEVDDTELQRLLAGK